MRILRIGSLLVLLFVLFSAPVWAEDHEGGKKSSFVFKAEVGHEAVSEFGSKEDAPVGGMFVEFERGRLMVSGEFVAATKGSGYEREIAGRVGLKLAHHHVVYAGYTRLASLGEAKRHVSIEGHNLEVDVERHLSFHGPEIGLLEVWHHKRVSYHGGVEVYPAMRFGLGEESTHLGLKVAERGLAFGLRYEGLVGLRVYRGLGLEFGISRTDLYGGDERSTRITPSMRTTLKF